MMNVEQLVAEIEKVRQGWDTPSPVHPAGTTATSPSRRESWAPVMVPVS